MPGLPDPASRAANPGLQSRPLGVLRVLAQAEQELQEQAVSHLSGQVLLPARQELHGGGGAGVPREKLPV